jgi:outer membrane protein assembly factor BamD
MRYLAAFLTILIFACAAGNLKVFDTPEDQFEYARKLYQNKKYDQAVEAFQTVIFRFHGTKLADSVTFYLGMCYFNQDEYILAVGEFRRLLTNYPTSPLADQAHYMVAHSYFEDSPNNVGLEQDGVKKSIQTIENFLEDFPDSPYRPNVRELLDSCNARLASKDFKNGMVYYKIGDRRAARIYFESVVTNYSIPEWVGKSLYMLAEIDRKEEKYDDARAKLKNMMNAFPEHEWFDKAKDKYDDILAKIENEQQTSSDERAQE